jgi:hypothetical protein
MGKTSPLIGLSLIGFGILLIWSAYTKKPLFGEKGLLRTFVATSNLDAAGGAAGSIVGRAIQATPIKLATPPGEGATPPGAPVWT